LQLDSLESSLGELHSPLPQSEMIGREHIHLNRLRIRIVLLHFGTAAEPHMNLLLNEMQRFLGGA
jgi:hypothetical protein